MKRERFDEAMKQHFQRIRSTLANMKVQILEQIASAAEADAKNVKKYNKEYLQEKRNDMRDSYSERVWKIKEQTKQAVNVEVAAIRMLMTDWISSPVPERLTALLQLYHDFHLTPTRAEIDLMRETAEGNFTAMKLINGFADQYGIYIQNVSLEEMTKSIREMESDINVVIDSYTGALGTNFKYLADDLGLSISPDDLSTYRPFAESFGRDEPITVEVGEIDTNDSLARCEALFADVMHENDLQLTESKRREIDRLFEDCESDVDKLDVAVGIMQNEGTVADLLPMYNSELSKRALSKIAEDKRRSAAKSMQKFEAAKEEAAKATQAATSADMAARQAAGDYSL